MDAALPQPGLRFTGMQLLSPWATMGRMEMKPCSHRPMWLSGGAGPQWRKPCQGQSHAWEEPVFLSDLEIIQACLCSQFKSNLNYFKSSLWTALCSRSWQEQEPCVWVCTGKQGATGSGCSLGMPLGEIYVQGWKCSNSALLSALFPTNTHGATLHSTLVHRL